MKKIIPLLIIIFIGVFLFWYFKNYYPQNNSPAGNIPAPSEIVIAPPPEFQDFKFQLQEATSTIILSWDETKIDIFYIVLLDTEKLIEGKEESAVWAISSLKLDSPLTISLKKKEVPAFFSSPYVIGEKREGFFSSELGDVNLEEKKEYYLQMISFDAEGKLRAASQTFKFGQFRQ